jgi:AcrR family transcriptional regulator
MSERREELIEKALDDFLKHGLAGLSLRPLAGRIGTSARLLVYHFGSKDGLIAAVMDEVRARTQRSFRSSAAAPGRGDRNAVMRRFWTWIVHPANAPYMRLLFEVQALALQNPAVYARYLQGTSSSWLKLIESSLPPSRSSRARATLCAAVIDGLLLEYLSTGDRRRTTGALDLFIQLMHERTRKA